MKTMRAPPVIVGMFSLSTNFNISLSIRFGQVMFCNLTTAFVIVKLFYMYLSVWLCLSIVIYNTK